LPSTKPNPASGDSNVRASLKYALAVLTLAALCVVSYIGLYAYSVSKVEVRDVQVTEVRNVNLSGAEVVGYIELYNGGLISVSVDAIDYRLILEQDMRELAGGSVDGGPIPAGQAVDYPFTVRINWMPSLQLAYQMITAENTYVRLEGEAHMRKIWFIDVSLPFEYRINMENHLSQPIKAKAAEGLPDGLAEEAGTLIQGVRNYLPDA
jgi:LEA14-like dessication related protein